jgi:hypothetical protein
MSEQTKIPGLRRPVGVWRAILALGDYRLKDALWPETALGLLIGGGGAFLVVRSTDVGERIGAMGDVLALAGALLAVIFAALAIVVSLPSTSYLRMLGETTGGMRKFLDPFLVAVGTQIALLLLTLAYRFVADDVASWIEHAAFYVIGTLFVFGVLDVANLARQLVRHGVLRAADAAMAVDPEGEGGDVHRLPDRRGGGQGQ